MSDEEINVQVEPALLTRLREMFERGELEPDPNVPPIRWPDIGLYVEGTAEDETGTVRLFRYLGGSTEPPRIDPTSETTGPATS